MGIELDVLTGHPEHDLLFIATPVARAAGLKNPADAINQARKNYSAGRALAGLICQKQISLPKDVRGYAISSTTVLFSESEVYDMLLRGHAPQSEPFRKWVTEEVLPTIRETGKYDAEQSTNPIAQSVMDELKTLREGVSNLTSEVSQLKAMLSNTSCSALSKVKTPNIDPHYKR